MAEIDLTDAAAIRAQRERLAGRVEALDMILAGLEQLKGGPSPGRRSIGLAPGQRARRSKSEVEAIKNAAINSARSQPATKPEIFNRLVAAGEATDDRLDSELVLRTLKQATEGPDPELYCKPDGTYGPTERRDLQAPDMSDMSDMSELTTR